MISYEKISIRAKREDEAILYHVFGDDALFDDLDDSEESDLRYVVAEHLKKLI